MKQVITTTGGVVVRAYPLNTGGLELSLTFAGANIVAALNLQELQRLAATVNAALTAAQAATRATYRQALVDAWKAWWEAESKVPEHDYQRGYAYRRAKANKLWTQFARECEADCLAPVTTSHKLQELDGDYNLLLTVKR